MKISDFDYHLPEHLIAQNPKHNRNDSRLLVVDNKTKHCLDAHFYDLKQYLKPNDLLILNNTQVFPARIFGQKETGGKIEVLVERILDISTLLAHIKSSKSPKLNAKLILEGEINCIMLGRHDDLFILKLDSNQQSWLELLSNFGHMPLPPYIERQDTQLDQTRYQTVYAKETGAVAAPTAGLHFTNDQLTVLAKHGIEHQFITLHVGAGTFQPVRGDDIDEHIMHKEWASLSASVCDAITKTKAEGGRIVAVGTTVTRCLEFAALSGTLRAFEGDTDLFIKPGFNFNVVDALITNFHLPKSTLLMLVSAFASKALIDKAYLHAIDQQYRFFSYGDAMFLTKDSK